MTRRVARPLPRDLDRDAVKASFAALIAGGAPSAWDDWNTYQEWGHSITRIQGFDLGYLPSTLRGLILLEAADDETEREAVRRGIELQVAVHADCRISFWAGLMAVVMLTTPGLVDTVVRWRETAPDPASIPRRRPRRLNACTSDASTPS